MFTLDPDTRQSWHNDISEKTSLMLALDPETLMLFTIESGNQGCWNDRLAGTGEYTAVLFATTSLSSVPTL
jgi:hypothetical protein